MEGSTGIVALAQSAVSWIAANIGGITFTLVGTLLGGLITWIFHRKALAGRGISYQLTRHRVIGYDRQVLPRDVEIRFKGTPVTRLDRTVLILWNSGHATINGADVVVTDPLRLVFHRSRILDARIVGATRRVINASVRIAGAEDDASSFARKVAVEFDYLDHRDGVVIEVLHAPVETVMKLAEVSEAVETSRDHGNDEEQQSKNLELRGSVKGMPEGPRQVQWGPTPRIIDELTPIIGTSFMALFFLAFTGSNVEKNGIGVVAVVLAVIALTLAGLAVALSVRFYHTMNNRPPKPIRSTYAASR